MRNGLVLLNKRLSRAALCVAACFGGAASLAAAAPTLPTVVAGQASFSRDGNVFSITNTPGTIINWQSFSVNAGEVARFIQQSSDSAVLNRVNGQDPSRILGALQSNGKVFLINPNGVVFGQGARVDVNGLVASTLDMRDADFLAGKNNFSAGPNPGDVRNEGAITTPSGGKVFLVAPKVENSGIITAPNGAVVLAAGRSVQLVDSGNPDLSVVVSAPGDQAVNLGQVVSQGGRIGIYGALVNQRGVVNADSAVVGRDGRIVLKASKETTLEQGSVTSALGAASGSRGGEILLLGERVSLTGNAQVDASGAAQGGAVLVGGDYQGKNAALPNAQQTVFGKDAAIRADATAGGDGGQVVLWSDGATAANGSISARGAGAGAGGLIETSGRRLDIEGVRVDAGGGKSGGRTGTWLIDPTNIVISDGGAEADTTYIKAETLVATDADIVLQASNNLRIEQDIATAHDLRAEAGNELTVAAAVRSTGGSIDLRANGHIKLLEGSLLASQAYIDLKSNRMTLAGSIGGLGGVAPTVSFNTFDSTREIVLRGAAPTWALGLDPARLGAFDAYAINIGNSGHAGAISIDQGLTMAGHLAIDTGGAININAAVRLTGADSQFIGTLHRPVGSGAMVSDTGSIEAAKKISLLGADQVQIFGAMKAGAIEIGAAGGGIQLNQGSTLTANDSVALRSAGALYQEGNALVKAPRLLVEGESVQMLGANQVGTLAGKATGLEAGNLRFRYAGDLKIGTVAGVSGLAAPVELALQGGALTADADIAARAVLIEADAIGGSGRVTASSMLYLESGGGIGSAGSPLHTSAPVLDAFNTDSGSTPINIRNDRALVVRDVVQTGSGSISIETSGGLTVAATPAEGQGVRTGSGDISLVTRSPLTVEGRVSTESGNVTLLADNDGALTIREGGRVASASGTVRLTGGEVSYPAASVVGKLEVVRTKPGDQQPDPVRPDPPPPQLNVCLANPETPGCSRVLEVATRACMGDPDAPGCAQVLPPVDTCRTNPGKLGCAVVMQREEIRQCIANPKAPGCSTTLPPYDTCAVSPATYGCAPVIAERAAVTACMAAPTAPGCSETLPPLAACRLDAGLYGCAPVIARAEFLACVANPTGAGCGERLPALSICKATPALEGCAQVLQVAFDACLVNRNDPSCAGILPTLSQCESNKAMAGCEAVLPTLQQCIGSPTLQGCAVMLPKLEQCAVNPRLAGCEAVLPQPGFCSAHPTDPRCAAFNPAPAQGGGEAKKPVATVQQSTVNLINTRTPAQEKLPAPAAGTPGGGTTGKGDGGAGEGEGTAPSEQPESQSGPAAATNTGVKNEKPATKMYCN